VEVHPTAVVHPDVVLPQVGAIGPFCVVEFDVELGEGTVLGPSCVVHSGTRLGENTRLTAHVVLGGPPQDSGHDASTRTTLVIGRGNTFREFTTAHRGTSGGRRSTVIGDGNLFMVGSHVAHDCRIASGCTFANGVALGGFAEVGDGAVLGGLCAVHQLTRIGRLAMVGGGAMCAQDVPPFTLVQGDRARLRGLNRVGLHRHGLSGSIPALKIAYRTLFMAGLTRSEAVERVTQAAALDPAVAELLDFVVASERGVCRTARR
jgi:UDP-N-acetylglucosamine acyltransferase